MVRGPVSMVVMGGVLLLGVILAALGPRAFENVIPESALAWIDENVGSVDAFFGPDDMLSTDFDPADTTDESARGQLQDGDEGWKGTRKIAAMAGNTPIFVSDIIKGRRSLLGQEVPGQVAVLQPLAGCSFTAPAEGSLIGLVSARGRAGVALRLASYEDSDLADGVASLAVSARETGRTRVEAPKELAFVGYDVIVTETARPVFLVLESDERNRVWNIVLAKGARLDRVVLLGGRQVGIANLPEGIPVEVMRNEEISTCGNPVPTHPLNPGHRVLSDVQRSGPIKKRAVSILAQLDRDLARWSEWFRAGFGADAAESLIGNWRGISMAVVGPAPASAAARVTWVPIKDSRVLVTTGTYLDTPASIAEGVDFPARVEAITKAFAGGDLATLRPEVRF